MKSSSLTIITILFYLSTLLGANDALTFSQAYKRALENANSIKSSQFLAESDEEKINQEKSQLYPQINLSGSYKKSKFTYQEEYVAGTGRDSAIDQGLFNGAISLKQAIYKPTTYSRIDLQKSRSKYSKIKVDFDKEQLAQNVFSAYLELLKSRSKIELLNSSLEYNKIKYSQIEKQYAKSLSNRMDLLEMKVEYDTASIELSKEEKLFQAYKLKLEQFIGEAPYILPTIQKSDAIILSMIEDMQNLVHREKKSLKIKQAEIAVEISKKRVENAWDAHLPTVTLDASYSKYARDNSKIDIVNPYDNIAYVMVNINLPLYSGGYTSSTVLSSRLEYEAALQETIKVKKEVNVEYNFNLVIFQASIESVKLYHNSLASAQLYVDSVEEGFKYGLKSIVDVNKVKNKFYRVKYKYIENIYDMVNSYIALLIITHNFDGIKVLDKILKG